MSIYILVHGAWHGSWCWNKVIPLLEQKGHKVEAPDLPGHGRDKTPLKNVTFQAYITCILSLLDKQSEPVILLGHSLGGAIISQVAEKCPNKIKTLVYLSAFLLKNGESATQIHRGDTNSLLVPNMKIDQDRTYCTINNNAIRDIFYSDCSIEDIKIAESLIDKQAFSPFVTPVRISEENFGQVDRVYIECLQDMAITTSLQKKMYSDLGCRRVISLDRSHSPFFSAPEELVDNLISL
ncbi:MAG: alpha/beta fold hydrolase [Spirochaetota bacterium]|nr:alpha/beta fold hydrolase [Spirochaetota bacterium]